jgi:hypothetical protein
MDLLDLGTWSGHQFAEDLPCRQAFDKLTSDNHGGRGYLKDQLERDGVLFREQIFGRRCD